MTKNDMEFAKMESFNVYSWTLQEYISCVKKVGILDSVQLVLDSSSDNNGASVDVDLVTSKLGAHVVSCLEGIQIKSYPKLKMPFLMQEI